MHGIPFISFSRLLLALCTIAGAVVPGSRLTAQVDSDPSETTRFIIEQKLAFLSTAADASMLWWVSSVVFCAGILAAVWRERRDLAFVPYRNVLMGVIGFFLLTIVLYGILVITYTQILHGQLHALTAALPNSPGQTFSIEVRAVQFGVAIGTSSFLLLLATWVFLWISLRRMRDRREIPRDEGATSTREI